MVNIGPQRAWGLSREEQNELNRIRPKDFVLLVSKVPSPSSLQESLKFISIFNIAASILAAAGALAAALG